MDNSFELPNLPEPWGLFEFQLDAADGRWVESEDGDDGEPVFSADQMQAYARTAQSDLIGRLAQMQEHEAIEWVLKARQDWWKS